MAYFLRQLPVGARFMLCRTKQKFRLLRRDLVKGSHRLIVQEDGRACESSLHHSCRVKPVIRAQ